MKPFAKIGYLLGTIITLFIFMMLTIESRQQWLAPGPANPGHDNLVCSDCHTDAEGTMRQQLQANFKAFLGLRASAVTFGYEGVANTDCQACHDRPNDTHPVFRFNESRFIDARKAIAPQLCSSCHLEHQGKRVSIGMTFCVYCHPDLELVEDPLDVSHSELIAGDNWESCMGCHDYHGSHDRVTPTSLDDMIEKSAIEAYFNTGDSPYATSKFDEAKESKND